MSKDAADEIRRAAQDMDGTLTRIKQAKAGKQNAGLEATYGQAYQRLVRLGARPQLRLKYRGLRVLRGATAALAQADRKQGMAHRRYAVFLEEQLGLSARQLAERLGVSKRTVHRYRREVRNPD